MHAGHPTGGRMHGYGVDTTPGQMEPSKARNLHMVEMMLPVHEDDRRAKAEADREVP